VIGAFVRGLSMRDVVAVEQAGLGRLSKSTAWRICEELRERREQFRRRSFYDIGLVALLLDATFISVRPSGRKEGVLVARGFTETEARVLLSVTLGMRESYEDWQALGRDLIARGLGAPMLIVADGAPGLIKAIEHCWPASDRRRCCGQVSGRRSGRAPSCTCATRRTIAAGGGQRICSSAPWARSNGAPSDGPIPRRGELPGLSWISSSPTRPTASASPSSIANDSTTPDTTSPNTRSRRR
jgi:hypothetical protein